MRGRGGTVSGSHYPVQHTGILRFSTRLARGVRQRDRAGGSSSQPCGHLRISPRSPRDSGPGAQGQQRLARVRDEREQGAADCNQDKSTETKDEPYLGLQGKQSRDDGDAPDQKQEFDQDFDHDRKSNARIMSPFVFRSVPQSRPAWPMVDFLSKAAPPRVIQRCGSRTS